MPALRPRFSRRTSLLGAAILIVVLVVSELLVRLTHQSSSGGALRTDPAHRMIESAMGFGGAPGTKAAFHARQLSHYAPRTHLQWSPHPISLSRAAIKALLNRVHENDTQQIGGPVTHVNHTSVPGLRAQVTFGHSASKNGKHALVGNAAAGDLNLVDDVAITEHSSGRANSTLEPSTARAGDTIILTGNWFAGRSRDGGQTWEAFDPYSFFGKDFCCDQVVVYSPQVNRFIWSAQSIQGSDGGNHLQLDVSSPDDAFDNPCTYTIDPTWFNLPANTFMDYEDLGTTDKYLYLTTNFFFPPKYAHSQGAAMLRLPLAELADCTQALDGEFAMDSHAYHLRPVQNAGSTMYLATDNISGDSSFHYGSTVRLYSWHDGSGEYSTNDITVPAVNFESSSGGPNGGRCGSEDGVVGNWCQRTSAEISSATLAGGQLILAEQAAAMGSDRPFPYTRLLFVDPSSLSYQDSEDLYNSHVAIQYTALATDTAGDVGGVFAWGGGTGADHYYPGIGLFVVSADGQHNAVDFEDSGDGNACTSREDPNKLRWGDYFTIRPVYPDRSLFAATGFELDGGDCGNGGSVKPHEIEFGPSS